ncbi:unnamed protein product [Zymoseptoria tritici ST99CH_3D1]|nr:unnamed protein product [Zymoseptoria tritici ST99CH_3D1]
MVNDNPSSAFHSSGTTTYHLPARTSWKDLIFVKAIKPHTIGEPCRSQSPKLIHVLNTGRPYLTQSRIMSNTIEAAVFNNAIELTAWNTDCKLGPGTVTPTLGVFDKQTASYQQLVKVQTNSPHTMRSYTIGSGPAKGYRVLVLTPEAPCRIFDLPIELREIIYEYVLADKHAVELKFFNTPGHPRIVQKSFPDGDNPPSRDWDSRMNKWKKRNRSALSMLLLNKQITAEAIKILYGSNTFRFACHSVLAEFLVTLMDNGKLQHLRHLQLNVMSVGDLRVALRCIYIVPNLRSLQLTPPRTWIVHINGPSNLEEGCKNILKKAQGPEAAGKISRHIEHFVSGLCTCGGCYRRIEALETDVKEGPIDDDQVAALNRSRCKRTKASIAQHEKFWSTFRDVVKAEFGKAKAG